MPRTEAASESRQDLEPASSAIPTATADQQQYDDDDQKSSAVHNRLLSLASKRVFNAANGVSDLALDLVTFAFALELAVSGQLPGDFLYFALCLFGGAFDPVLVNHGSSPLL